MHRTSTIRIHRGTLAVTLWDNGFSGCLQGISQITAVLPEFHKDRSISQQHRAKLLKNLCSCYVNRPGFMTS